MRQTILTPWILSAVLVFCTAVTAASTSDMRVLIDVSGSMKKNDPANLRKPALQMLVELLPVDTLAGVWMFAEDTNELVAPDVVNQAWKLSALNASEKIHSRGLFTNIEAALDAATQDWSANDPNTRRSLILLTDGVVDVSKQPEDSIASRNRILDEGLRKLRALGVTVHTIGLSGDVDAELMSALTSATDGWQESASNASTLQRIFLRMFEQAVQPDTVPLEENRFLIDDSISEFTVLIFNGASTRVVKLILPDGTSAEASDHPESFSWRVDSGYHLITVNNPASGEWNIDAELDPDNRVLIVTNLQFEVTPSPANLLKDELLSLSAYFTQGGVKIARQEFLELVDVSATLVSDDHQSTSVSLRLGEQTNVFSGDLDSEQKPGRYELTLRANSQTFSREVRQRVVRAQFAHRS